MKLKSMYAILSVTVSLYSSLALAQSNSAEANKSDSLVQSEDKTWFEKQAEIRKSKREAARQYQANARYCAAPTYVKKGGKWEVLYEGKCESGGFSGSTNKTSLSERKSKL